MLIFDLIDDDRFLLAIDKQPIDFAPALLPVPVSEFDPNLAPVAEPCPAKHQKLQVFMYLKLVFNANSESTSASLAFDKGRLACKKSRIPDSGNWLVPIRP